MYKLSPPSKGIRMLCEVFAETLVETTPFGGDFKSREEFLMGSYNRKLATCSIYKYLTDKGKDVSPVRFIEIPSENLPDLVVGDVSIFVRVFKGKGVLSDVDIGICEKLGASPKVFFAFTEFKEGNPTRYTLVSTEDIQKTMRGKDISTRTT